MKRQTTFDDSEPVIEKEYKESLNLKKVKFRSRAALEVYDEIQAAALVEDDPLYDY